MIIYYAAMSLDGRISGPDHDLSFLKTLDGGNDYEVFYANVDSLIMGARTWDFMVEHGSWPYAGKPTWVVTHAEELAPLTDAEPVERFAGDVAELVRLIGERGLKRTWLVGGGDLAGQLLAADLLDELILTVAPALVGARPCARGRRVSDAGVPARRVLAVRTERRAPAVRANGLGSGVFVDVRVELVGLPVELVRGFAFTLRALRLFLGLKASLLGAALCCARFVARSGGLPAPLLDFARLLLPHEVRRNREHDDRGDDQNDDDCGVHVLPPFRSDPPFEPQPD